MSMFLFGNDTLKSVSSVDSKVRTLPAAWVIFIELNEAVLLLLLIAAVIPDFFDVRYDCQHVFSAK